MTALEITLTAVLVFAAAVLPIVRWHIRRLTRDRDDFRARYLVACEQLGATAGPRLDDTDPGQGPYATEWTDA
jgi:hypothetical protein